MEAHCDRGGVSLYGSGDGRAQPKPAAGEKILGCRGSMTSLSPAYVALSNRYRGTAQNTISPLLTDIDSYQAEFTKQAAALKVLFTRQLEFHSGTVHKYTNFKHSLGLTKPFNNNLFLLSQPATVR